MEPKDYYSAAVHDAYHIAAKVCAAGLIDPTKVREFAVEILNNMWTNLDEAKLRQKVSFINTNTP